MADSGSFLEAMTAPGVTRGTLTPTATQQAKTGDLPSKLTDTTEPDSIAPKVSLMSGPSAQKCSEAREGKVTSTVSVE